MTDTALHARLRTALGVQLRRARLDADLTLEALSHLSGVSDRTISDIERGACRGPQRRTVQLLVDALDLRGADREEVLAAARAGRVRPLGVWTNARR